MVYIIRGIQQFWTEISTEIDDSRYESDSNTDLEDQKFTGTTTGNDIWSNTVHGNENPNGSNKNKTRETTTK